MGTTKSLVQENLPQIFKICSLCNRVNHGDGSWLRMEHLRIPSRHQGFSLAVPGLLRKKQYESAGNEKNCAGKE